jgi:hypothetical protein
VEINDPESGQVVAALHEGQFQYDDHATTMNGVGVVFHGEMTREFLFSEAPLNTCETVHQLLAEDLPGAAHLRGSYRPKDKALARQCDTKTGTNNTCRFEVTITDTYDVIDGTTTFEGDLFYIDVISGPFAGYTNDGPIQGGNIDVK